MNETKSKKFYITTAIPYVNASPHLGHALEFVQTDVIARYHRSIGQDVLLLSGADENALKNVRAAEEAGSDVQAFVDANADLFQELADRLNIEIGVFQKGSDREHHYPSSQRLWELCAAAGDIYEKTYEGLYCIGCELFYGSDELNENGECFEHPGRKLETVSEKNHFFRLSKYQKDLTNLISSDTLKIIPASRKNEIMSFLSNPLQDISISRSNARAKNWGVPVPGDDTQRMYVWFDALNIYQSGIGFGWDEEQYRKWWPADVHVIGKGITRFHAIYWPAFLLSAKLPIPKGLFVHGYITVDGQKMSKTLGNVIDPIEIVGKYGVDPVRYYLLREIPSGEDGDFSYEKFEQRYNGDLANGLGNLVARVAALGEKISPMRAPYQLIADERGMLNSKVLAIEKKHKEHVEDFRLNEALGDIWELIGVVDKFVNDEKPWTKQGDGLALFTQQAAFAIDTIRKMLDPFLPETAAKIREQIMVGEKEITIKKAGNLFPRLG